MKISVISVISVLFFKMAPREPFKFLDAYTKEDADIFFGRDAEIEELYTRVFYTNHLLVYGQSGTGKTSLIQCGLANRFEESDWLPMFIRYGDGIVDSLEREVEKLAVTPVHSETLPKKFNSLYLDYFKPIYLILDQFEELFIFGSPDEREQLARDIAALLDASFDIKVMFVIREEYLAELTALEPYLPDLFSNRIRIERMGRMAALQAIEKPCEVCGISIEEGLAERVLEQLGTTTTGTVELTYLQVLLDKLYKKALARSQEQSEPSLQPAPRLTTNDLEALGTMGNILAEFLEEQLAAMSEETAALGEAVLKTLITSDGTKKTMGVPEIVACLQSIGHAAAPETVSTVVNHFVAVRILSEKEESGRYELRHDSLAEKVFDRMTALEKDLLDVIQMVENRYKEYQTRGTLLDNAALTCVAPYQNRLSFKPKIAEFIHTSKREISRVRRRRMTALFGSLIAVLAIVSGLGIFSYINYLASEEQREIAEQQQQIAETQRQRAEEQTELANLHSIEALNQTSKALFLLNDELGALVTGVKAGKKIQTLAVPAALKNQALFNLRKLLSRVYEQNRLEGHESAIESLAFSSNGKILASGSQDTTIKLWNVADGQEIHTLYGHPGGVTYVAFNPDGTWLAAGTRGDPDSPGVIKLWDVPNGKEIMTLPGHAAPVDCLAVSPDGTLLASAAADYQWQGEITIWNVENGEKITTLQAHTDLIGSLTFNPAGTLLASGSDNGTVKLWSVADWKEIPLLTQEESADASDEGFEETADARDEEIEDPSDPSDEEFDSFLEFDADEYYGAVTSLVFSQDGRFLAAVDEFGTVRRWERVERASPISASDSLLEDLSADTSLTYKKVETWYVYLSEITLTFASDGTLLASGNGGMAVYLWNVEEDREIASFYGHSEPVSNTALSPDGTRLASGGKETVIRLWEITDNRRITTLQQDYGVIKSLVFSPDGEQLASGGRASPLKLWNVADGSEITTFQERYAAAESIAFLDPDTFAFGNSDATIELHQPGIPDTMILSGHTAAVTSLAFDSFGFLLASGSHDAALKLWDVERGKESATLRGHAAPILSLTFSPDDRLLASGSEDAIIKIWDVAMGEEIVTFEGHSGAVLTLAFSPDGSLLASGGQDAAIKLWHVAEGREIATFEGHSDDVTSLMFSPDGDLLASGSRDTTVKLWHVEDGRDIVTLSGHASAVQSIAFDPDGALLASGSDDTLVKFWDVMEGREIRTLSGHADMIRSVRFSPDGSRFASVDRKRAVKLWDVADGSEYSMVQEGALLIESLAFSPNGTLLASGAESAIIKLWDVATGHTVAELSGHSGAVKSLAFSPDGRLLASGSADRTIKLWSLAEHKEIVSLHGHADSVNTVAFHPDGGFLISGSQDKTLKLWDIAGEQEIATFHGHSAVVNSVAFSPDGTLLVSGSYDKSVKLWSVEDTWEISSFRGHADAVLSVAFSPDGTLLISGSADQTIKVWDVETGAEITTLDGHYAPVESVMLSPDGTILVSGTSDGTITLWDLDFDALVAHGCQRISGYLKTNPNLSEADRLVCLDEEIAMHRQQIELDPQHADAWNALGVALFKQGKFSDALKAFQEQATVTPGHANAWYFMGRVFQEQDDQPEAIAAFREQIEHNSHHQDAWYRIGEILQAQGSLDEAITAYHTQIEVSPGHEDAWNNLETALQATHKPDELVAMYQKQAHILEQQHKLDKAIAVYQKLLKLTPDNEAAWLHIGNALEQLNRVNEAIAVFQKLAALKPGHEHVWYNIGKAYSRLDKFDEALEAYQQQIEVKADYEDTWFVLGHLLQRQGKLDQALHAFHEQIKLNPDHERTFMNIEDIAIELLRQGKAEQVILAYQTLTEIQPDYAEAWGSLGDALRKQGRLDEAITAFEKQAEIFHQQNRSDDARYAYREILDIQPDHKSAWYEMGKILYAQSIWEEAVHAFRRQIDLTPDHKDAWYYLGESLYKQGYDEDTLPQEQERLKEEAIAAFQKQIEIDPAHEKVWDSLGLALYHQGNMDEAISAFRKQVEVNPELTSGWGSLSVALYKSGNVDEAAKIAAEGLTVHPDYRFLFFVDSIYALAQNDITRCRSRIAAALPQVDPGENLFVTLPFLDWLAQPGTSWENVFIAIQGLEPQVTFRQGTFQDIAPILERLDPKTRQITQHFIDHLEQRIDFETLQSRLIEDDENAWVYLGNVYYRQGDLEQALTDYRKQVERTPEHADAWNGMGKVFWEQGNRYEAEIAFANALNAEPHNLTFLHNDAKLALEQGNLPRCQERIATAMPLVTPDSPYAVLFPFYAWLADPDQGWEPVMAAIEQLEPGVQSFFAPSTFVPFLERQDEKTRTNAQHFIDFFQNNIDLEMLKARLEKP